MNNTGVGYSRKMLDLLSKKTKSGRFVSIGAEKLAKQIDSQIGTNTITGCARTIRSNIKETLKKHLNIDCRSDDVLVRDDQGYHLNHEKISVRIVPDEDAFCCAENVPPTGLDVPPTGLDVPPTGQNVPPIQQNVPSNVPSIAADVPSTGVNVPSMGKNVPASTENVPSNVPPTGLDVPPTGQNIPSTKANVPSISSIAGIELETVGGNRLNCRQKWIVEQIEAGGNVTRSQVEEKFGVSDKTAKRDLAQLVSKMMIQYVRKPHPGHYVRMR